MNGTLDVLRTALEGRYRVDCEVGAGGMATVYLAHDAKHDRRVAIKVLRPELLAAVGSDRFLREIKLTAALQHPHILPLFDSGDTNGIVYYVMPFVDGESLRTRLDRVKQLPIHEALDIARAVASALDYAHNRNIVHRDIKPENILLGRDDSGSTPGSQALVADFGVAVAMESAGLSRLTETGMAVGTPAYMSPEQASAERSLSAESDVYSLAAVVYEMLVGEPPFTGPTGQAIVARVLTETPVPMRVRRSTVSKAVDAAVSRALAKVPADRFPSAGRFADALQLDEHDVQATIRDRAVPGRRALPWMLCVVLATLLVIAITQRRAARDAPFSVSTLLPPAGEEFSDRRDFGALSRDGRWLALVIQTTRGVPQLWVRNVGELRASRVVGAEGASAPFWSPDGQSIGFFRQGMLFRISSSGGSPERLADAPLGSSGVWARDDAILFSATDGIRRVGVGESGGGTPQLILRAQRGQQLLRPSVSDNSKYMLLSTNEGDMYVGDARTGVLTKLRNRAFDAQLVGDNAVAFVGPDLALFVQGVDLAAARLEGDPVEIGGPVRGASDLMSFTTSAAGSIAYLQARPKQGSRVVGRDGVPFDTIPQEGLVTAVGHMSRSLAVGGNVGLYRYDIARRTSTQLYDNPGEGAVALAWSPDDSRIAFSDGCLLRVIEPGGGGLRTFNAPPTGTCLTVTDWPAGDEVIATKSTAGQKSEIWQYRVSDGAGTPLVDESTSAADGAISPDGGTLAYAREVMDSWEIFARPMHAVGTGSRISFDGGRAPRWRADGRELFFVTATGDVMSAAVSTDGNASIGTPKRLFHAVGWERSFFTSFAFRPFDVNPDASRFYLSQSRVEGPAVLLQNVTSRLSDGSAKR